jgi:hypothetical protein
MAIEASTTYKHKGGKDPKIRIVPKGKEHLLGLTQKQRIFVEQTALTGSPTQATKVAYPNSKYPSVLANDELDRSYIRAAILTEMDRIGVNQGFLAKKLSSGLNATKIHTSHTEPDREIPDFNAQHRYLDTALKLYDAYPSQKVDVNKRSVNVDVLMTKNNKELATLKAKLRKQVDELKP